MGTMGGRLFSPPGASFSRVAFVVCCFSALPCSFFPLFCVSAVCVLLSVAFVCACCCMFAAFRLSVLLLLGVSLLLRCVFAVFAAYCGLAAFRLLVLLFAFFVSLLSCCLHVFLLPLCCFLCCFFILGSVLLLFVVVHGFCCLSAVFYAGATLPPFPHAPPALQPPSPLPTSSQHSHPQPPTLAQRNARSD